jgi:hypothetical protein
MLKLLASLLVVGSLSACYSNAPHVVVEPADPIVGDLHCARPQLTILEAMYYSEESPAPVVCEAR